MSAAGYGHEAVVNRLLAAGADVNAVNVDGRSALMWAAEGGDEAIVDRLLAAGANVEALDTQGRTALQLAVQRGDQAVADRIQEWVDAHPLRTRARTWR